MVIVNIHGGLGNQLDTFACGYAVAKKLGEPMVLDISNYMGGLFRPYVLDLLAIPDSLKIYYPKKISCYSSIMGSSNRIKHICEKVLDTFMYKTREELLQAAEGTKNVYVQGPGGVHYCSDEEKAELFDMFQLRQSDMLDIFRRDIAEESVSVHIRRTDFVRNKWVEDDLENYYRAGIVYLTEKIQNPVFYIFSDDMQWAQEKLGYSTNFRYVNVIGGIEADVEEMFCMSACVHHIQTNQSTFGYWAYRLSKKKGIVLFSGNQPGPFYDGIVLNKQMIENFASKFERQDFPKTKIDYNYIEHCIGKNDNEKAIEYINKCSFDENGIPTQEKICLMEYKGICYLQEGYAERALSIFDLLLQYKRDDADFNFNIGITYYKLNRYFESVIYLGNAARLGLGEFIPEYLLDDMHEYEPIYNTVAAGVKRNFIFINGYPWWDEKGYFESVAIYLRNLGHDVTFIQLCSDSFIEAEDNEENRLKCLEFILQSKKELDEVYKYGIDSYTFAGIKKCAVHQLNDLLDHIGTGNDILIANSYSELVSGLVKLPVIFMDALSEWDIHKHQINMYTEEIWNAILQEAKLVLTDREQLKELTNDCKIVTPNKLIHNTDGDEVFYVEKRLFATERYMHNEECLWGVLSLLELANNINTY